MVGRKWLGKDNRFKFQVVISLCKNAC